MHKKTQTAKKITIFDDVIVILLMLNINNIMMVSLYGRNLIYYWISISGILGFTMIIYMIYVRNSCIDSINLLCVFIWTIIGYIYFFQNYHVVTVIHENIIQLITVCVSLYKRNYK